MERNESTISLHREKEIVRGLTNKLDDLKSATLELDEQLLLIRSNKLLSDKWTNNALLDWVNSLIDEVYERINEIVGHVVENDMLKEEEE